MNSYKTIYGKDIDLDELSPEEKAAYNKVKAFAEEDPEWWDLRDFWINKTARRCPPKLYRDLETRLCLRKQQQ
ncbi:hypothetical protein ES703_106945 [subsurface metagenome]